LFFFKINSTIQNHLSKVEIRKEKKNQNQNINYKKNQCTKLQRALWPCIEALESLSQKLSSSGLGSSADSVEKEKTIAVLF